MIGRTRSGALRHPHALIFSSRSASFSGGSGGVCMVRFGFED
jgi:hypothetical protein